MRDREIVMTEGEKKKEEKEKGWMMTFGGGRRRKDKERVVLCFGGDAIVKREKAPGRFWLAPLGLSCAHCSLYLLSTRRQGFVCLSFGLSLDPRINLVVQVVCHWLS